MKKLLLVTTALVAAAGPAHAGPVMAAAAWVGGVLSGSAGVAAAFAMNTALSMGLSAIAGALYKPPGQVTDVSFDVKMGDDLPLSFIVGDYVTAGKRKYIGSWGKNTRYITEVVEVSALPHPSLAGMWVNDEEGEILWGETDTDGTPYNLGHPLTNRADEDLPGKHFIWVRWLNGTQTAADPTLVALFGDDDDYPWTAEMVGRGKSYAVVTTRYNEDTLSSYPTYLFKPSPLPCYDLRFDSTNGGSGSQRWDDRSTWQPSRNNAVVAYNIARGIYYGNEWIYGGKNLPAWRLPQAEWIAAANACDAVKSRPGGGSEPSYRCGLEISVDTEPARVLEEIGKGANMKFAEVGGRLKPIVDLPGAAVFSFTDGDILITEGQSFRPFYPVSETFNAISATYPEPGEKWTSKDAPIYVDAAALAADDGRYLPTSMSYPAVPHAGQVQRLMRSQMRDYRRMRQHQFSLPPDAYALEPGIDVVSWTSERNGYSNKLFMVERAAKVAGMNVPVTLREIDPSDYDWSSDFEQHIVITTPKNPVPFVQPINGLTVTGATVPDASGNARRPAILVACSGDEVGVTHIQIEYRVLGRSEVIIDPPRPFVAPFAWYLLGVLPDTDYEVRARLISDLTPKSAWSGWFMVRTPDVGLAQSDLAEEVRDALDRARDFVAETPALLDEIRGEADAARQLAIDNLLVAQNYTDTSVNTETVARQTDVGQLSARINEITAANTSGNLLTNPDFADGATGWTGVTVSGGKGTVTAAGAQQTVTTTFNVAELLQWRIEHNGPAGQVRVGFLNGSGALIGSEFVTNVAASTTVKVASGQHAPPEGAAQVRFRVTGTGLVIDNAAVSKIDQQTIARIQALEAALAADEQALATYQVTADARFINVETKAQSNANALLNTYTRSETNQAIAGQINTYNAEVINPRLGEKASVSSVSALTSRVSTTEQGMTAQGESITSLTADVGKFKAGGMLRASVMATPTGALSRIGLFAVASANDVDRSAGLYLEAVTGSKSRALVVADQFAVVTGPSDAPKFPFIVDDGSIRMDADVWIKSLSIGPDKIQVDGLSSLWNASFGSTPTSKDNAAWVEVGRITLTSYYAGSKLLVVGTGELWTRASVTGVKTVEMRVLINGSVAYSRRLSNLRTGGDPNLAEATRDWASIVGMRRSVAGANTVIVQVRQLQDDSGNSPHGGLDGTSIYVAEFKR